MCHSQDTSNVDESLIENTGGDGLLAFVSEGYCMDLLSPHCLSGDNDAVGLLII